MALSCPVGFDAARLRAEVRSTYERVARDPHGAFHFHRGPVYAERLLGYDAAELALLPRRATDRFAGVGHPTGLGPIAPGETVLDHACGAGTDLLLAARRVGPHGRAIGVDLTPAMRDEALDAASEAGLAETVDVLAGVYEDLPVEDASVDVVISNGVVNLAPDKRAVFREIARVLRPGGRLYLADVVVARELKLEVREDPDLWAACVAGALQEQELLELSREVGLVDARIANRWACFAGTSAEEKVATDLRIGAAGLVARRAA